MARWVTTDSAAVLQSGFKLARQDLGIKYELFVQNSYKQSVKKLNYKQWRSTLTNLELWSFMLNLTSPDIDAGLDHINLLFSFWTSSVDGTGGRIGLSHYFNSFLHADLIFAYDVYERSTTERVILTNPPNGIIFSIN